MSSTVVVGGTGFLGSHLVERLAREGGGVTVVARRASWPWREAPARVRLVAADVSSPTSDTALAEALRGADAVVNLAGVLARPGIPEDRYRAVHVEGASRLAAAARREAAARGGLRLVHVSTTGVLGPTGVEPVPEDAPPRPRTLYEATKLEGERAVLAAAGEGLEVVVVRPGLVYGPRDLHLLAMFRAVARGSFRLIAGGRAVWQPVHATDVARALAGATRAPGLSGAVLHVAGSERMTFRAFAERIARALGTRLRGPSIPFAVAWAAGAALEAAFAPFGAAPPLTRARVRTMTESRVYAIDRARELLDFAPEVALDNGLAATVAWYRARGYLT